MPPSTLLFEDFRSFPDGVWQPFDLDKACGRTPATDFILHIILPPSSPVEMSSRGRRTDHGNDDGPDTVVLSDLIDFLSGLALSPSTADAAIREIQARTRPSLFGTPPPSPATFPISPQSSHGSSSQVQESHPQIHTPAPSPLTAFTAIRADDKQPAAGLRSLQAAPLTSNVVRCGPMTISTKSTSSGPSTPQTTSSIFTTAFGNANIASPTRFEVLPESLRSLPAVGLPKLSPHPKGRRPLATTPQGCLL
ncbi:hypothetical protein EDD15DRAFT_2376195 [Pisolithus albus]|nr:hypothetical protein EDD15DRAFT_2376195 [Pisolithus albus]